jgi:hypothetical protein
VRISRLKNFIFCCLLLVVISCSTQKDGFTYRVYHNVTAHYNGYFNAEESIKAGLKKVNLAYKADYDNILPVFVNGTDEISKTIYPEMERAIEKSEKVINRHTLKKEADKKKKRPVFNKYIDENYMVIGKSYFYKRNFLKAEQVFKYVNGKYQDKDTQLGSATWLARALIEQGEYSRATQALKRAEPKADSDEKLISEYHMAMADVFLHQENLEEAAKSMETSLKYIKKKKNKARPHFILAQIYQAMNKSSEAITNYEAVLKSRPIYELEFYAKINKALSFSRRGGNSDGIKKELMKMLKDEKNISYRDQIYYALGDLALEEQDRPMAIYYFEQSNLVNVDNKKQKAKTFLKLADLYFDQREYVNAQVNYDSTQINMDEKHPRYREVKARAESLTELVGYLNTIELNDSVSKLCSMSEADLERALRKAVKDAEAQAEERKRRDEELAAKQQDNAVASINGSFWAYNENLRNKGLQNFTDYWGERPLKDNWRLQSRLNGSFGAEDESDAAEDTTSTQVAVQEDKYKVPTIDELRASLPCGDEAKVKDSQLSLSEAYYRAGVLYKENLDDFDNATDIWEQQILNMEESDFHPMTHYQLYRTWLYKEQLSGYKSNPFCTTCSSVYWGNEIKSRYPDSEWARLIDNPEYLDQKDVKDKEELKAYELVYEMYTRRMYIDAMGECNKVIESQPENHLICKYKLLRAVCIGYSDAALGIKENVVKELNDVKADCPGTEEAARADEILKGINKEVGLPVVENTPDPKDPEAPKVNVGSYKFDESAEHYLAVLLPVQGTNITQTKTQVSDYNLTNWASSALKVTNNLLDKDHHIVLVKPFQGMAAAADYKSAFTTDQTTLKDLNAAGYDVFLISKANYITLFKSKAIDDYLQFFKDNY